MKDKKRSRGSRVLLSAIIMLPLMIISIFFLKQVIAAAGSSCLTPIHICACDPNCQGTYEEANGFNTIDSCVDGFERSDYEYVEKMFINDLNGTNFKGRDRVSIHSIYYCYPDDYYAIAYSNYSNGTNTRWRNIHEGVCAGLAFQDIYYNFTLDDTAGFHAFRFSIAYPGEPGMICADAYSSSDTDDIVLYVQARPDTDSPIVSGISPTPGTSHEYTSGIEIQLVVNATDISGVDEVYANVTWLGGSTRVQLLNSTPGSYNATLTGLTNITRYNITFITNDTINNTAINNTYFLIVNNAFLNISSPALGNTYPSNDVTLRFKANDNNTPYQEVYYSLNSEENIYIDESMSIQNSISESTETYMNNTLSNLSQSLNSTEDRDIRVLWLRLKASTANWFQGFVEIRNGTSSGPSAIVLASGTINSTQASNESFGWANVTLNTSAHLNANAVYWIILNTSNSTENFFYWETNLNGYSSGNCSQNTSLDLLFKAYDLYRYETTITAAEGSNSMTVCEKNILDMTDCSITSFKTDTRKPYTSIPTETADPFEFGDSWQVISLYVYDDTSDIDTVLFTRNDTDYPTDNIGGGLYQYRWYINSSDPGVIGTYNYLFIFNDSVGNINNTAVYNFTVRDSTAPIITNISHYPTTAAALDPNVNVSVNASITDYTTITSVMLQYKRTNDSEWTNRSTSSSGSYYYANFTPSSEANWSFRMVAKDQYNNTNTTAGQNLSVALDTSWTYDNDEFDTIFTTQGTLVSLGNITLNNTGDYELNFTVVQASGVPIISMSNSSFLIPSGSYASINFSTTAPAQNPTPYPYSITVSCSSQGCEGSSLFAYNITGNIMIGEGGAYLATTDVLYPTSVIQSQRRLTLNATIKNIGNETAYNVSAAWTIPEGWTTTYNLTSNYTNITVYQTTFQKEHPSLVVSVGLNATTGTQAINLTVSYSNKDGVLFSEIITKSVLVEELDTGTEEEETPPTGGNGGSGGGGGGSSSGGGGGLAPAIHYNLTIDYPERISVLRGQNATLTVNLTNNNDAIFLNISLIIEGFPMARYSINPKSIGIMMPNKSVEFVIKFNIPIYMGYSTNSLLLAFNGKAKRSANSSTNDYTQEKDFTLIISEVDQTDTLACLRESEAAISELESRNFTSTILRMLLNNATLRFGELDYTAVKSLCEQIIKGKEDAFALDERISKLTLEINKSSEEGYDMSGTQRLLELAKEMFISGEYDKVTQRIDKAQESMTLQIQSEDAILGKKLTKLFNKYWWVLAIIITGGTIFAAVIYKEAWKKKIKERMKKLQDEESSLTELIKKMQHEHFVEKTLGTQSYNARIEGYKNKMAEIAQERIKLQNIQVRFFKKSDTLQGLQAQKEEIIALIRLLQENYFVKGNIDKNNYNKAYVLYKQRLGEINKKLMLREREEEYTEKKRLAIMEKQDKIGEKQQRTEKT